MGMRQMTFDIPEDVAEQFSREVPPEDQSAMVATLLRRASLPLLTEQQWDEAAMAANDDPELNELMKDWQAAADPIEEPWDEPASR